MFVLMAETVLQAAPTHVEYFRIAKRLYHLRGTGQSRKWEHVAGLMYLNGQINNIRSDVFHGGENMDCGLLDCGAV
jgi:hypothetical protein